MSSVGDVSGDAVGTPSSAPAELTLPISFTAGDRIKEFALLSFCVVLLLVMAAAFFAGDFAIVGVLPSAGALFVGIG